MINLVEVDNITDDLIHEYNLVRGDVLYECCLDYVKIGYAVIRKKENDRIFLILAEKYQNKGYGSIIFNLLISKIDGSIICFVPFENIKIQKIIQKNDGVEIGRNGKGIHYIIERN